MAWNWTRCLVGIWLLRPGGKLHREICRKSWFDQGTVFVRILGRAVGVKGQQAVRVIVGLDGKVINAFPVHVR